MIQFNNKIFFRAVLNVHSLVTDFNYPIILYAVDRKQNYCCTRCKQKDHMELIGSLDQIF